MFKKIKKIEIMPTMYNFWNDKNKLSKKKKKIEDKILMNNSLGFKLKDSIFNFLIRISYT